ncbi:AAA family ATPase [Paenibacillus sp. J2TS4]|uniref:AAA family ATPase n=1 Tax=Paenibacillus sp. J2TS4 TaxID=2807194 RepID=UPI001B18311D|nr:AAA family ATPase [Paenibacillus sp. J2TS4]GIP35841.1 nuclease SbcCD subunit C [Paenibacillus sp. J2TS4]
MRPVYLALSGLQSYREKQEIDFTRLCDAGVFGIFGPTGSGKSSILDAITLALYGKVERASNGTQGILNHAEKVLSVTFAFELSYAGGVKKFRVERQFKRGNELSVNNTISRLIDETDGGSLVLADKVSEVNQQVQLILGLSMQDFTRAVVLPQGKFAEFLSLKGSERRQMLQRLFHLEQYGDLLNARVSRRLKDTESVIRELAAEQQGLGDASEQAVTAAKERFRTAEEYAKQKREQRQYADQQWEDGRKIYLLQQELGVLRQQEQELAAKEPAVRAMEQGLQRAAEADALYPLFREWEEARRLSEEKARLHKEIRTKYEQMTKHHDETSLRYTEARKRLAEQEAPLRIRMEELQQALRLMEEAGKSEASLRTIEARKREAAARKQAAEEELLKERELHAKAVRLQSELKERQRLAEVSSEERRLLHEASNAKQQWALLVRQRSEAEAEAAEAQQRLALAEQEAGEAQGRQGSLARELQLLGGDMAERTIAVARLEQAADGLLRLAGERLRRCKEEQKEREIGRLASILAASMAPGDACPVCGSVHHPDPAKPAGTDEADGEAEELEKVMEHTKELQVQTIQLKLSLSHWTDKLAERLDGGAMEEAAVAADIVPVREVAEAEEESDKPAGLLKRSQVIRERLAAEKALLTEREARLREAFAEWKQWEQRHGELAARIDALRTMRDGTIRKLEATQAELRLQEERWKQLFPQVDKETLENKLAELRRKDEASEELRKRLDKSVSFLDESLLKLNGLQAEMVEREKECLQLDTEGKGIEQLLRMQEQQLIEKAGSEPVDQQIAEVQGRLKQLISDEREQSDKLERLQEELRELNRQHITSEQDGVTAAQQLAKAEANWHRALEQSPFSGEEEVRSALLTQEAADEWSEEVKLYRERKSRLQARLEHVEGQLDGASMTEEKWEEIQKRREDAHQQDEQALSERAKAERDLDDVIRKHAEWSELEAKRIRSEQDYGRLHKLQTVFRGNAFVEFIAEEQLMQVSGAASQKLGQLTRQRYAIEVDSSGGFVIRDDANGGIRRPVSSLSGGETFLTSLALALALSAQIQLSGQYPLEFFFLDEGFGTLDPDLLETVIGALEKLHTDRLTVGIISHVPELKARLPRRLIVQPAEPSGQGSRLYLETL